MTDKSGLALMREPFADNQISYLPKGGVKLAYVGHAALTDRLLSVDPLWNWEFNSVNADGTPVIDKDGGMWIKLTVCGVTRLGYGDAQGKTGGNAMKERIGDALRNAAMRFGAALDLWHKGDLHVDEPAQLTENAITDYLSAIEGAENLASLRIIFTEAFKASGSDQITAKRFANAKDNRKAQIEQKEKTA